MKILIAFAIVLPACLLPAKDLPPPPVGFKKVQLLDKYITEGASIGDVNADGKPDIIAGPLWWQGPDFKKSHGYAPVKFFPTVGPGLAGYANNFFTFPDLITEDEWADILKVGIPGQPAQLAINPGKTRLPPDNTRDSCPHHKTQDHICNESPQYLRIFGRGRQLVSYSHNRITLSSPDRSDFSKPWKTHPISPKDGRFSSEHGLGVGDINGDELPDILEKRGWWEQPADWDLESPWKFHPFPFAPQQGGAQMFAYDIDGDGDNDVVTALNAHSWGMAWYEQFKEGTEIKFKAHTVMTDTPEGNPYGVCFSQPHAMDCVDIDGDGIRDIVTGKCYFAHNGRDPGAHQPAVLYWFRTTRNQDGTAELVPYLIDDDSGVGRQISTGDLNGDGRTDIVVGNKKGVFAFFQVEAAPEAAAKKIAALKPALIEGEALQVTKRSGSVVSQGMLPFGDGNWSGNSQLWWTKSKPGDQIELSFHIRKSGAYHLGIGFTKANDYGIIEVALDNKKIGSGVDLYNDQVVHTGTLPLGEKHQLEAGMHRLSLRISGSNPKAKKAYMCGIDYILVHPGTRAELIAYRPKPTAAARQKPESALKKGNAMGATAKPPQQQLESFKLPPGFAAELVSSEAQGLVKPISIAFDDAGRLWTQTAREYPKDKDTGAFQKPGTDQVLVFDTPCERGVQTPRVYADGLTMPVSVLPHDRGVFIVHGPDILLLEDTDKDGRADKRRPLITGFGIQDTHTTVHQLTRTPGGWISLSQGCNSFGTITDAGGKQTPFNRSLMGRFKPSGTNFQITGAGMNNIWCWAINGEGRTYLHEANDLGYSQVAFERDATYPSFVKSLRYPDSIKHPPTAEGLGLGGTGFSGIAISEGRTGGFPPPWSGVHFVANPITGSINTVSYKVDETGRHTFEKQPDLLTSSDPMFRPIAIAFGPDGCLYIIDWYNRIISHNEVRTDHPARDKVSGRIWRIRHESQERSSPPNIETAPDDELLSQLASGNIWQMRAAWHQVAKRNAKGLIPGLKNGIVRPGVPDSVRVHLLWCLESLGHFDAATWKQLLADQNPNIRREAVRSLSSLQPGLGIVHPLLTRLSDDSSYPVRNEVVRFYRDTPQPLSDSHKRFLESMITPESKLSKQTVKGWGGSYLAPGGAYELAFLNLLIDKALNRESAPPPVADETRWNRSIATHPTDPGKEAATEKEIRRLLAVTTKLKGDPGAGKSHYQSRCASCHDSKFGGFAPALNGGESRSIESILTAVFDPNAAVESVFLAYRVVKNDGTTLEGFRSDLTHKDLTLTYMGGGKVTIPLADIKQAGYVEGKSVMLESMGAGLKDQGLADLIAYIRTLN